MNPINLIEQAIDLLQKARPNISGLGMPINQLKIIVEDHNEVKKSLCNHPEDKIYYCLQSGGSRCRVCKKLL